VIAGNHGDFGGPTNRLQPSLCPGIFAGQRKVAEIAGDDDVFGGSRLQIARDRRQHIGAMDVFALTLPIDVAEAALARELGRFRRQRQMQVRQMRKCEHRGASAATIGARDRRRG